ncbi:MAG: response regulator transcription factor [Deltaproteobacteria bacterium]|jgi:DNA-binding response OmpR family regulator|nr:response regulator transcription factor [Deltaproteobacteria bacterium]
MNPTILIIDDDAKLNQLLKDFLKDFGYDVITATHPAMGLKKLKQAGPDLVILDIMLPDMDGFEVCRVIRQSSNIPIIMLTARGEVTDKVVGLELGADDYLAKPFEPRELVARIQSVLRRSQQQVDNQTLTFERLTIDLDKRTALLDGNSLDLTTNEFAALALLARNAGKVLNRDQILQELRGMDCDAFNRSVDIAVSRLRQKLNDNPRSPEFIKTVWGSGYVFIAN